MHAKSSLRTGAPQLPLLRLRFCTSAVSSYAVSSKHRFPYACGTHATLTSAAARPHHLAAPYPPPLSALPRCLRGMVQCDVGSDQAGAHGKPTPGRRHRENSNSSSNSNKIGRFGSGSLAPLTWEEGVRQHAHALHLHHAKHASAEKVLHMEGASERAGRAG